MAMWALTFRERAANETAAAWFPEELVTIPRFASSGDNDSNALNAPRTLKAPLFWKFSHLKKIWLPTASSSVWLVSTGVRWMYGAIRSWTALISLIPIASSDISVPYGDYCINRSFDRGHVTLRIPQASLRKRSF